MGLRERVTITLVIIALIQIACRHCMPRTPTKASLKSYLNDVKPLKNNPVPTRYSPSQVNKTPKHTFGKTAQNGRISQTSLPKKSLYQTYKFPENEYPLDNSPRDPFCVGMNFNDNNHIYTLQKARNLQSSRINDLKKEMKMKRKLLGNKQVNNENSLLKRDMSSIKFSSDHDSMRLLDSVSFPEIQYPLSTMETWGPNYWNQLPFNEEKQLNEFRQQAFNLKAKEVMNNPFTRLTKAKASKYLQSYDKLKEEHKSTSTENSKRSNAGQKGLNFTKTATCERVSDDFITASLASNIVGKSTDMKKSLQPAAKITPSLENTYPVTEDPYYPMPIPYKVIENNTQNVFPAFELKNNTKELQDFDTNDIVQTLYLIEKILLYDDTSKSVPTENLSKDIENNLNVSDSTEGLSNEDILTTLTDCAKNCTDPSTKELCQKVSDDAPADILQDIMPLHSEEIAENTTIISGPLNVRMPFQSIETITNATHPYITSPGETNMATLPKSNAVPGTTSIIIIPINSNNFDGKSLSHLLKQIMSSSLNNSVPNNRQHNVLSNIAPLQNDNPSSTALVSELLNSISDSGSSLPIYETLPTNSMCYSNESNQSALKEKLVSDILIHKSLTDDAPFVVTSCNEKLFHQPIETGNNDLNTVTRSPTSGFKHPFFDFADGEFISEVSHEPYNNAPDNELPILTREIIADQQISNVSSENLFITTRNKTSEYLHKYISNDTFQTTEIANDALIVAMNQNFSTEIPIDSIPQPINEMLPTPITEITVEQPLPADALLTPTPLSETLSQTSPEITDWKLPSSPVTVTNSAPNVHGSPMMTDVSLKTELYKIRQILDKMLSSEIPTDSQTVPMDKILSHTSDSERLPLLVNKSLEPTQTPIDIAPLPAIDKTTLPVSATDSQQAHETLSHVAVHGTSSMNKSHIPNLLLDTVDSPPHPTDEIGPPTPVFENPTDSKPYLLDNLVTPLSKTRTKDTSNNDLSSTIDDIPSKMDLMIPDIYEVSSEDLSLSVVDLPIMVHQKPAITLPSGDSYIQPSVTQELKPQNLSSDNSVNDLLHPANAAEVSESHSKTMSDYTEKVQQNIPTSKDLSSSQDIEQLYVNLPLSIQNITEDVPDIPILTDDSPPSVSDKITKVPHTPTDTKVLPLVMDRWQPTEDTTNPDTLVTDTAEPVTLSLTNEQQSINLDGISDNLFSKTTLSDIIPNNLPLSEDKLVPQSNNTPTDSQLPNKKASSTSKLPIAKALLENVLSDITKGGLSSRLKTKSLSVTPSSLMNDTLNHVDVESLVSEAKEISPVNTTFSIVETSGKLASSKKIEDILPVDKMQSDTSFKDIPADFPLKIDKIYNDKRDNLPNDIETQEKTEILSLYNPAVDVPLPTKKVFLSNDDTQRRVLLFNQNKSSSKLPITKAILENVLSDVSSRDFTLLVSKSLPVKSSSMLDKTLYFIQSPVSEINENSLSWPVKNVYNKEHSDNLIDNNLPFSGQIDPLQLELVENLSEVSSLDIPTESSITDKILPNSNDTVSSTKRIIPKDTSSDLPLPNSETLPTSNLPIAKALLENVLSDITKGGLSSRLKTKSLSVTPSSLKNKTLYHVDVESPVSEVKEISPVNTNLSIVETSGNLASSKKIEDILPVDKMQSDTSFKNNTADFPLKIDKIYNDKRDNLPNDIETQEKTEILSIDNPAVDVPLPTKKVFLSNGDTQRRVLLFNQNKSSSNLPITKAILEKVLSDVTSRDFTLPVSKSLPVKSSSMLDKNLYFIESPVSDINENSPSRLVKNLSNTEHSDNLTDNNLPFSGQIDPLQLELVENLSEISSLDIPTESSITEKILPNSNDSVSSTKCIIPKDTSSDLPLPNSETLPTSKLPIAKALLENVLSDITKGGLSSRLKTKSLSVTPSSLMNKTLYHVDVESPVSEAKEISPVNTTFSIVETSGNLASSKKIEDILPVDKMQSDTSFKDIPADFPLKIDKVYNDKRDNLPNDIETQEKTEILSLDNPAVDVLLPTKKVFLSNDDTQRRILLFNQNISSSNLPKTKAILEKVLSDVTSRDFTLPVSKSLPVKSSSMLDKNLYFIESPVSDINDNSPSRPVKNLYNTEHSDNLTDNNLPSSGQTGPLQLELVENLSEVTGLDIPTESSVTDKILSNSNDAVSSTKHKIISKDTSSNLPLPNSETLPTSKLPIAKALLENVLSNIETKGLSLPGAKSFPVESRSQLDKTLYFIESPHPNLNEESSLPDIPNFNFSSSEIKEDDYELSLEKIFLDNPSLDIPKDELPNDQIYNEDSNETSSDYQIDDIDGLQTQDVDKKLSISDKKSYNLPIPQSIPMLASRIPITKALLKKVLSDIIDGGIRP